MNLGDTAYKTSIYVMISKVRSVHVCAGLYCRILNFPCIRCIWLLCFSSDFMNNLC